ncbi:MAG: LytTR family DNA-binding domain-containing protein [Verrucomicrobiota bacterium]
MKLRVLIVDDEALARSRVKKMLAAEADVEVIGECADGPEAIAFIQKHRPDLAFLDVQMPEVSGFDVLRSVSPDLWPAVIFVTAHDQHALEAFEVHALDYLLKPFKEARFHEALQRARKHLAARTTATLNQNLQDLLTAAKPETGYPSRLSVKSGERTTFVKVDEVDYIEAAANYVILHVGTQNHILRETLTNLESRLSPKQFLRINRSAIVNLDRVKEVKPAMRGEYLVVLKNGKELSLTRGVREIQQRLEFL